ncbi:MULTISPECIES: hypothetical protein [unclassified Streptomyces]|uniref:hypothetical protein n=1 Tax=unclassified Streptomyces TaxID=2593676 RepID=UPI000AE058E2|nr:hypothetical protein [Streptomyces sp. CNQ-509]
MAAAYSTMAFAVVGIVPVALLKETAGRPLKGSPPAVATEGAAELIREENRDSNAAL